MVELFRAGLLRLSLAVKEWRAQCDDESLHALRVALRRYRSLFRVFKKQLRDYPVSELVKALRLFGDCLGAVRDLDVIGLLVAGAAADASVAMEVIAAKRKTALRRARRWVAGPAWPEIQAASRRLLDALEEAPPESRGNGKWRAHYRQCVRSEGRRILRAAAQAKSKDADTLHAFRIKLRRLRYLGEWTAASTDGGYRKCMDRVRRCERHLGRVHDLDMALSFLLAQPAIRAPGIEAVWREKRAVSLDKFRETWRVLRSALKGL